MKTLTRWISAAATMALAGAAFAAPLFEGRLADGTASTTCTVSGTGKCAMFYNPTLDITILNDWTIGSGTWSEAKALAAAAGEAQTDFAGWVLPTGDGTQAAGPLNQFRSILAEVGGNYAGLQAQFDEVRMGFYWTRSEASTTHAPDGAWFFNAPIFYDGVERKTQRTLYALAVLAGDVADFGTVPGPQTLALALLALGAMRLARIKRSA